MNTRIRAVLVAGFIAASCAALPHPGPADLQRAQAKFPGTTVDSLEAGRTAYVRRCSGCHNLRLPESQASDNWPRIIDEMGQKAHLVPGEKELITAFLVTVSLRSSGRQERLH